MRLQTGNRLLRVFMVGLFMIVCLYSRAQALSEVNPGLIAAEIEGSTAIDMANGSQIKMEGATVPFHAGMSAIFAQIKGWEGKYNSYLKTVQGFATGIKGCKTFLINIMKTLISLKEVKEAISANPQGVFATMSMNETYLEVAAEIIVTYDYFDAVLARGGSGNMLSGSERVRVLNDINAMIQELNVKLHNMALSIAYFNMTDVWRRITAGMSMKSHGDIAREAGERFYRAARTINTFSR